MSKDNLFMTVGEATTFLKMSRPTILKAIKSKKLAAIRDGNYWKIPLKILEAYRELRSNTLSSTNVSTGIDGKAIALTVLKREIAATGIKSITITKNYELLRGSTTKRLIDEKMIDTTALHLLCSKIYEAYSDRFFQDDTELDYDVFLQRLAKLKLFLEALKLEDKMLAAVKAIIKTTYSLSTKWVKLEACTGRLFSDQGPVFFGSKSLGGIQELIRGFCCLGEFTDQEVLDTLKALT